MNLSDMLVSLLLFSLVVTGPILYYSSLITGVEDKYGVTMSESTNTSVFMVTNSIIAKAETLQANTQSMSGSNAFTDFVNMLTSGLGTLSIMWDMTTMFTGIIDSFLNLVGIGGEGGWVAAGIVGVILIIITAKILSIVLSRDV